MNIILEVYPLSDGYKKKIVERFGNIFTYVTYEKLREESILKTVQKLRQFNGELLLIPFEDSNSTALMGPLVFMAKLTAMKSVIVVLPDQRQRVCGWKAAIYGLISFIAKTFGLLLMSLCLYLKLRFLALQNRKSFGPVSTKGKIFYINGNFWFGKQIGGSIGHIKGVIEGFLKTGSEVTLCSAENINSMDRRVLHVQISPPKTFGFPLELNNYSYHSKMVDRLTGCSELVGTSFIYQRMSLGNFTGVEMSRRMGVPLVLEYNGSDVWIARNWGRPLKFEKLAQMAEEVNLSHAHLIVTVSDALRKDLLKRGVETERIVSYPNGIDPEVFDPARFTLDEIKRVRAQLGISTDKVVCTFVGTFGRWHGAKILAQAIKCLVDRERAWLDQNEVIFLLVGDGTELPYVKELLAESTDYVRFTGLVPQSEAPLFMAASEVLLSPHVPNDDGSEFFGSPTKLFEYMAMEKGIIASDLGQIGDVFSESLDFRGNCRISRASENALGVLVRPGSVEDLIAAIKFLISNPEVRMKLGKNARREAKEKFTWETHVSKILAKLDEKRLGK